MSLNCVSESQRRLTASSIYSQPLKPWETRVLRLEPAHAGGDAADVVEVRLETAVIPHLAGLGLVDSGEVVFYEALSYTWDSNVFSHAIRCNGLDFSVTPNLHAALMHLRKSDVHRWLWIDALCINQYDSAEKERQVHNMFHIYRKAHTVLVWLGPAGPGTSLGADIVNYYDGLWQEMRHFNFLHAVCNVLLSRTRGAYHDSDAKLFVDEILHDLQESKSSKDGSSCADTLGLLSMALDVGAVLRRIFNVLPRVGLAIWTTRNVYLAGEEEAMYEKRLNMRRDFIILSRNSSDFLGVAADDDQPAIFRESSAITDFLHEMRQLVNDPTRRIKSRCTQIELLLVCAVEIVSRGFEASIAVDRLYSLTAMTDAISSASWGLTQNKLTASSPQQLPVDYSVCFRDAVLRALKIRMNEITYFYVAIRHMYSLAEDGIGRDEDRDTKSVLFSMCTVDSKIPSWFRLLEFNWDYLREYASRAGSRQKSGWSSSPFWVEQDVKEPDTLKLRGKALGRLAVDSEEHPPRIWMALPCPLGQEFETCCARERPVRALHQGCPDEWPAAADGARLDDDRNDPIEHELELRKIETVDEYGQTVEANLWSWQFPPSAMDGDVVVVFLGVCALLRPVSGGKYVFVQDGLRAPLDDEKNRHFDNDVECVFLGNHLEDLDTFVLI